jgi:hypothetical protein
VRLPGAFVLGALATLACAEEEPNLDRGTAPQIWCRGLCAAEHHCGTKHTQDRCEETCVAERSGLRDISEDGARALRPCIADLPCAALTSGEELWRAEMDACWESAKTTVDVSGHARSVCTAYVQDWFECGYYWSVGDCERAYSMWSDAVVTQVAACVDQPTCDVMRSCDATVWSSR